MRKRQYTALAKNNMEDDFGTDVSALWRSFMPFVDTIEKNKDETQNVSIMGIIHLDLPYPVIHNLVVTCQLQLSSRPVDLQYVYKSLPNAFYDRSRFAATTIRSSNPVSTALLFSSGKVVLTGAKGFKESCLAALQISILLQKYLAVQCQVIDAVVQNVVAHVECCPPQNGKRRKTLNIIKFYEEHSPYCTFQKNLFPGLIFRPPESPIVLLCFNSGRCVITGGKNEADILFGFCKLWSTVKSYIE